MSGSFNPKSRGQKRPKFAMPESMEREPRTQLFGQSIVGSGIGILVNRKPKSTKGRIHRSQEPGRAHRSQEPGQTRSRPGTQMRIFTSFCFTLIFAASLTNIYVGSHNLHGFKQSGSYHKTCLDRYAGIWMGQEHWLSEKQLPSLQQLGTQFVARSGMEDAISSGILVGRPFGGVSIAWPPHLDHLIKPLSNFCHKRVVGVELVSEEESFLFLCAYMPFFNSSQRAECMTDTHDAISMIETMIEAHPNHKIIFGGDLNCELKGTSPFDPLWAELQTKFDLVSCDSFLPPSAFTYFHESLDQRKLNDHFLVSKSLLDVNALNNCRIMEDGDNPSDHLPIVMTLSINANASTHQPCQPSSIETLKWDKLSSEQKATFSNRLQILVNARPASVLLSQCRKACRCNEDQCKQAIQDEYDCLMRCLKESDSHLPRYKPGVEKSWWTPNLTQLRNKSIDIHALWINQGRPRQGPTHEERLLVRAEYKRTIRAAQRAPKQASWDRLHSSLAEKDSSSFWKSWKILYNKNKSHLAPVVNGCSSKQAIANSFKDSFQKNCMPNNISKVESLNNRFSTEYDLFRERHQSSCDCSRFNISLSNTIDALGSMNSGKCADENGVMAEHFHNAPLNFLIRITALFNCMLKHAFVPKQFGLGFMIPILKDQHGNHADLSNYRGIT